MCHVEMKHVEYKGTHIYGCPDCPNVQFEYLGRKDIDNMVEFVEWDNDNKWGKWETDEVLTSTIMEFVEQNYDRDLYDDVELISDNQFILTLQNGQKFTITVEED
jgi:hypothetical protein